MFITSLTHKSSQFCAKLIQESSTNLITKLIVALLHIVRIYFLPIRITRSFLFVVQE